MGPNFLSVTWGGKAFHRVRVQDVDFLILVDALFLPDGGRREGKKKEEKKLQWERRVSLELELPCWLCSGLQW
jgi:hypothetical protein